jgi:carbamoylphosphate synthase large subunit
MAAAAQACAADVVVPGNELAIKAVAGREHRFPAGTIVASNSAETVARATDKAYLAALAEEAGVAAPPALDADDVSFPAVVKPAMTAVTNAPAPRSRRQPASCTTSTSCGRPWPATPAG